MRLASDTRECSTCKSYSCTCPPGPEDPAVRQIRRTAQGAMVLVAGAIIIGLLLVVVTNFQAVFGAAVLVGLCWGVGYLIDACGIWSTDK